jgi:hypothetical protein
MPGTTPGLERCPFYQAAPWPVPSARRKSVFYPLASSVTKQVRRPRAGTATGFGTFPRHRRRRHGAIMVGPQSGPPARSPTWSNGLGSRCPRNRKFPERGEHGNRSPSPKAARTAIANPLVFDFLAKECAWSPVAIVMPAKLRVTILLVRGTAGFAESAVRWRATRLQ